MPSGIVALLDDVAAIAKIAAASLDDVGAAASKAGMKSAGVVIDDAAVTPRYVTGFTPDRELPIIGRITIGSLKNKLLFLLPLAILAGQFAPFLIMPLLMIGGCYLVFEGAEKLLEKLLPHEPHSLADDVDMLADPNHEQTMISGAIRTDFILSAEIMALALNELEGLESWWQQAIALAIVAIAVTLGVYGAVALIVKMDDIGLHLARENEGFLHKLGSAMVQFMPVLLNFLSVIGTAAMIWVGGGILVHGLESFGWYAPYELIHQASESVAAALGVLPGLVGWFVEALGFGIFGLIVGFILVPIVTRIMGLFGLAH